MLHPSFQTFGILACLWLPACSAPGPLESQHELIPRTDGEHVVLADCRHSAGAVSSQMAYFPGSPGPQPQDVAVVATAPGQAALWINTNTSGLFTDTGVWFNATIGPKVADGQYAGTGTNGYGSFRCWQKYVNALYVYDSTTCSQVYYCNHDPAPAVLPTPINNTDTAPSSTPSSSPSNNGLAQGTIIGIVVGVVGGLLLAASLLVLCWFWRRGNKNQQPAAYSKRGGGCCGLFGQSEFEQPPMSGSYQPTPVHSTRGPSPMDDMKQQGPGMYEMDGQWYRVEMGDGHGKYEMDGQGATRESKSAHQETQAQPTQPANTEAPVVYAQTVVLYQQVNNQR